MCDVRWDLFSEHFDWHSLLYCVPLHHVRYVADHDWLLAIVPMSLSPARGRMDEVKSLTSRHQMDKALAALRPIGPQTSGQ